MCGIVATIGGNSAPARFHQLFNSIEHRGPDAQGIFTARDLRLGMNRLHLRGPDTPLPVRNGDVTAAFNGQIYGLPVTSLEAEVAAVRASPGTIDGMFACALATADGSSLRLVTDRYCVKPLFYRADANGLAVCSEIAPLIDLAGQNRINRDALLELLCYGWYLDDHTYVEGVRSVSRHEVSIVDGTVHEIAKARACPSDPEDASPGHLKELVASAVRRCLGGRGALGLALSGGLDSSILAWELNDAGVEGLVTLSVRSDDGRDGVASLAELELPSGGAWTTWKHRTIEFDDEVDFLVELEGSTARFGQPTTMSSLPLLWRLAGRAADAGVRVLLAGEGVDELFCGYSSYAKVANLESPAQYYHHLPRRRLVGALVGEGALLDVTRRFAQVYGHVRDLRDIEQEMRLVRLLLRSDVCLMSGTIEGRVPFLHNGIPEAARAVSWNEMARSPGKTLLRKAYERELGARTRVSKSRFKATDSMLRRLLSRPEVRRRLLHGASMVFGEGPARECLRTLESVEFDADVFCLLLTLAVLIERGTVHEHAC